MCEILAPSGNKLSALAAINNGADAIYLGLSDFSARNSAENFDLEAFKEIVSYAHAFGVKVYVALNTMIKNSELERFLNMAVDVWNLGADALILSDIFLGKYLKSYYPKMVLHLSTQAGVCNVYGARLAAKYGFNRVILARETCFEDIKAISSVIETEVFVQGALCTCFSGQCYFSSFAGGNSGNRGRCKQPCRKKYSINRDGYTDFAYRLSLSDLCLGENIIKLRDAGVKSFKIEGRMRRPEYVAAAVKYYKNILNGKPSDEDLGDLKRTFNRGNYTQGLAFGQQKNFISSAVQGHLGEYVGQISVINGQYICKTPHKFQKGDGFKILRGGKEVGGAEYYSSANGAFVLTSQSRLKNGDKVFITTDTALNERLLSAKRKIKLLISARFSAGRRAEVWVNQTKFLGGELLETANNSPLDENSFKTCFLKIDKYPFEIEFGNLYFENVFVAASVLNALRRRIFSEYFYAISQNNNQKYDKIHLLPSYSVSKNSKIAVISNNSKKPQGADIFIYKPQKTPPTDLPQGGFWLYLPPYMRTAEIESALPVIEAAEGIYCDGAWAIELCSSIGKRLFAGCGLNLSNVVDIESCPAEYMTLSKELTAAEQKELMRKNTFALSCGEIKLMDLIYCPFGKKCSACDKKGRYVLTDEDGRQFGLVRYETPECRFEVYNCASLVGVTDTGILADCGAYNAQKITDICKDEKKQIEFFKKYTRGHSNSPVL